MRSETSVVATQYRLRYARQAYLTFFPEEYILPTQNIHSYCVLPFTLSSLLCIFLRKKFMAIYIGKNQRQRILRRFPSYADNLPLDVIELLFDSYTHEKSLNQYQDIDKITRARRQQ